jgi:hypothetical protein
MKPRRAPMIVMWLAIAVAAAVLVSQGLPIGRGNAEAAGFGGVRPVGPPPIVDKTFPAFAQAGGVTLHLPQEKPVGVL